MVLKLPFDASPSRRSFLVLLLLTLQSAGVTLLATLTQRGAVPCPPTAPAPALAAGQVCQYNPVHLLATAEVIKFVAALLWCAADVYKQCTTSSILFNDAGHAVVVGEGAAPSKGGSGSRNHVAAGDAEVENTNPIIGLLPRTTETTVNSSAAEGRTCKSRGKVKSLVGSPLEIEEGWGDGIAAAAGCSGGGASAGEALLSPRSSHARSPSCSVGTPALLDLPGSLSSAATSISSLTHRKAFSCRFYLTSLRTALGLTPGHIRETFLMVIPAVLYAVQNTMVLRALQLTDPAVFQLCYLIRILFLACFMRIALNLQLTTRQCVALVLLTAGIGLAQWRPRSNAATVTAAPAAAAGGGGGGGDSGADASTGLLLILCAALISSGTGVFLEVVFKRRGNYFDLSARNVHLAFFSILVFLGTFAVDYNRLSQEMTQAVAKADFEDVGPNSPVLHPFTVFTDTFFKGFTGLVWCLVLLQSLAGILLALVMKYSNNILKTFSTSLALLISMAASVLWLDMTVQPNFVVGLVMVLVSVFLYNIK